MKMPPDVEARVRLALDAVVMAAGQAQRAPDLDATASALNRVWFAVHAAQRVVTDADAETRRRALDANSAAYDRTLSALYGEQA